MAESKHTPTPWDLVEATEHHGPYIVGPAGDIADLYTMSNLSAFSVRNGGDSKPIPFVDAEANAAFIVRAVNAHDALVEALREALPVLEAARRMMAPMAKEHNYGGDGGPLFDKIKAALARALTPTEGE